MPFIIPKESIQTFEKEGSIKIADFLSETNFLAVKQAVDQHLEKVGKGFMPRYLKGRDLFRSHEEIRKGLLRKDLQHMTIDLTRELKLMFAFDQVWDARGEKGSLFIEPIAFENMFSVSPLQLGAILCLEGEVEGENFPNKPNEIMFLKPGKEMGWGEVGKGSLFLLFGFAPIMAIYNENPLDPNTHSLKRLNYQNHQPLNIKTHPLIKG